MVRYDFRDRYPTAVQTLEALQSLPVVTADSLIISPRKRQSPSPTDASTMLLKETQSIPTWKSKTSSRTSIDISFAPPVANTVPEAVNQPKDVSSPTKRELSTKIQGRRLAPSLAVISVAMGLTFLVTWALLPRQSVYQNVYQTIYEDPVLVALLGKADRLRQEGNYREAISTYDQAITRNPKVPEANWGRCYSLNKLSQPDAAFDACAKALKLNPKYPEAFSSQGYALHQQTKYQAALEHFDYALELKPEFAEALTNKGVTLQTLGFHTEALAAFNTAIQIDPNYAELWANKGAVLWSLKQYEEALSAIDRALEIDPDHLSATKLREQARQQLGH